MSPILSLVNTIRLVGALFLTALIVLSIRMVDLPVALWVKDNLYRPGLWSRATSDLPDLLLLLVLVVTVTGEVFYRLRSKKSIFDETTSFLRDLAWTAPASYLAKAALKPVFGRINTRFWLENPELYGFHWLQSSRGFEGFPSGHMLVVTALLAAATRSYPDRRPHCLLAASLLGIALVVTNYHFVSDVIAGAWAGLLVEALVARLLSRLPPAMALRSSD